MGQNKKLKLFISYSHQDNLNDNPYIEEFKKHLAPLKDKGLIEEWYDRKILPGEDYESKIDNNLEDADIICLFISANFFSSKNCKKEKKKALELEKKKGIFVIPIILSHCGWQDDEDISHWLALPTDGKPISNFPNRDEGWLDVYNGLKRVIEKVIKIKQLKVSEEFEKFLQNTELFEQAHSQKERVLLDDIFVYPELDEYNELREYKRKISTKELLESIADYPKIVIAGENQSGKTTLCKIIFNELRKINFVPIYICSKGNRLEGKKENIIAKAFKEQYEGVDINEISQERIVPIVDDFHYAKKKERHLNDFTIYSHCIILIDDVFSLNIKDEKLIEAFSYFKINELKSSLRYELIKKWVSLREPEVHDLDYKDIDQRIELIDSMLGKTIGRGILPAYPFFILSGIFTYETVAMRLNQEITSQGYCYQAFIYFYLRKQGVKNAEIDTYINFLTELAFYFYKEKKYELSPNDFASFMNSYLGKYNLPIKQEVLLKNLSLIVSRDSFNNYSFRYPYIYYFFVAKYLAENINDSKVKKDIERTMNNLHVDENAYIAVFMIHHSKNVNILDELELNALCLFDRYKPATLTKDEVKFFDEQANIIIKAVLPPASTTPENERIKVLKTQDEIEQSQSREEEAIEEDDAFGRELRRAIRTVEVMGCVIKNRAGSLEKKKIEEVFFEAMNIYLRILYSFFDIVKKEDERKFIIDFILKRLEKINEEKKEEGKRLSEEKLKKISKIIFWNLNFFVVYGIIYKIVHSLGSDKLTEIIKRICDECNTPAAFLIKHGILMWYDKSLQINELSGRIGKKDFSEIAKKVLEFMVVNHCAIHPVNYKDKQRIEAKLGIRAQRLLSRS